jgi:hypothetical protein
LLLSERSGSQEPALQKRFAKKDILLDRKEFPMTGKRYYLATLGAWQRHTHRLAGSHFIILDDAPASASQRSAPLHSSNVQPSHAAESARILVLVEGDEGAHLALDDDPAFEPLPRPLAQKPISSTVQVALAPHGVASGATTFDAAEALASVHPLLRHTVF